MALHLVAGDIPGLLSAHVTRVSQGFAPGGKTIPVQDEKTLLNELQSNSLWSDAQVFVLSTPSATFPKWLSENADLVRETEDLIIVVSAKAPAALKKAVDNVGGKLTEFSRRDYKALSSSLLSNSGLPTTVQRQIAEVVGQEVERIPSLVASLKALPESSLKYPHVVQAYLGGQGGVPMWGILDAIDAGNASKALSEFSRINEPPIVVHAAITAHLQRIFEVSNLSSLGVPEIAKILGVKGSTYPLQKASKLVGKYKNIERMLALCVDAGANLRGGTPIPAPLVLEILIGRLCLLITNGKS